MTLRFAGGGILLLVLAGCGGGGSRSASGGEQAGSQDQPTAEAANPRVPLRLDLVLQEDSPLTGSLWDTAPPAAGASHSLVVGPGHGSLALDADTGAFTYTPEPDYAGPDAFQVVVGDDDGAAFHFTVSLDIQAVNDPPRIAIIPDVRNSPTSAEVVVPLPVDDADGDPLSVSVTVDDAAVVEAEYSAGSGSIVLRPREYGSARITVEVRDATELAAATFQVTVADVTRRLTVASAAPGAEAVSLLNTGAETSFELTHNGYHAFASMDQIVAAVRKLPGGNSPEELAYKLWLFVRDNGYHRYPFSGELWTNDTWATLNSLGWGFCSNFAAVYLKIAEAMGLEARVWGLSGHVVPEVRVNGRWQMYDPDLGVYYYNADGWVAGVEELAASPSLVRYPLNPIFDPGQDRGAYGQDVADIYSSTANNTTANQAISVEPFQGSRITLPAGARLVYPGRWTPDPVGYDGDDPTPHAITQFRQARLELPPGFVGRLPIPWVPWEIQGAGRVRFQQQEFATDSSQLRQFLNRPNRSLTEAEVLENPDGLALIMMINPIWYDVYASNDIALTGKDVWAIEAGTVPLDPANRPPPPVPDTVKRPKARNLPL